MKRTLITLIAVLITAGMFWVCGEDFNKRGASLGFAYFTLVSVGCAAWAMQSKEFPF
jgi:hypothetical protein